MPALVRAVYSLYFSPLRPLATIMVSHPGYRPGAAGEFLIKMCTVSQNGRLRAKKGNCFTDKSQYN